MNFISFISHGLINLPWWGYLLYTFIVTHITILSITIYLHRHQAHRALELHPIISHFFRFWLWMTTGMVTKEWAAIHRKHHAFSDKEGDPHSPLIFGIKKVLSEGAELYQNESKNLETLKKYGYGTPDDWIEKNIYTKHHKLGVSIMLIINIILFGPIGLTIWAIQMMWTPINAAGIINGIGHFWGYRNFHNTDNSRNILPFGILIGGEELHNNHHTFATSAKLSSKWYEFDLGWAWIKLFSYLGLAKVKKTIPVLGIAKTPKAMPDIQTLEAIVSNRYNLVVGYVKTLKQDCKKELKTLKLNLRDSINWSKLKNILAKDHENLTTEEKTLLEKVSENSQILRKIFSMRAELATLWQRSSLTKEELITSLQNWCKKAEASGIEKLQYFSVRLRACY
ncbi:MAG TPA: fatty acid desaturase [Burkholderiales bacterium]|nr:fatty acid desaturase [Burkholderiales bacterium]